MAQHGRHNLDFVVEIIREERPQRTIDQTADQRFLFRRPAFALEEAARNATGGKSLFLVVHRQREEFLTRLHGFRANGGAKHDRIAVAGQHGAIGLARDLAGFQHQLAATPFEFFTEVVEHMIFLQRARPAAAAWISAKGAARRFGARGRAKSAGLVP